jgi:tRNA 2-thiouridine synthesizing protein A
VTGSEPDDRRNNAKLAACVRPDIPRERRHADGVTFGRRNSAVTDARAVFGRTMVGEHEFIETVLDLRGLHCPQPVLRAKKALRSVPVRGVLVLECTDPLTMIDVPHFVNQTGHLLQAQERRGALYVFRIVKQK